MTNYILNIITLFGGLALFLFGMDIMSKSLERSAGGKLQTILAKMRSTVFKGFLLGLAVTAVIHTLFNVCATIVLMPMNGLLVKLAYLEAHEYLNALKAGELSESVVFSQRFAKYKAQYTFPDEV